MLKGNASNNALSQRATRIHLNTFCHCSNHQKQVRATAIEAILGAVWLDSQKNLQEVERVARVLNI